ncbi:MAG: hypothetical protein V4592_15350 [Bacteroidota bacterium]
MDNYRSFDLLRTGELTVIRHGWFRPWYELTDGQFMYGKLSYAGWLRRTATAEVAGNSWIIKCKGAFSRSLFIKKSETEIIGEIKPEIWTRKIRVAMNNGFDAVFTAKKLFCRTFSLTNDQYGDMFSIEPNIWKFKTPFRVTFNQTYLKTIPDMPLLMLTGIYLVLLRQQQAAAAAQ